MSSAGSDDGASSSLPVRVIRSDRRKKTTGGRIVGGEIVIRIPSWLSPDQEAKAVARMVERLEKRRAVEEAPVDLMVRARQLAAVYRLPVPRQIRWVTNQNSRWGSCTFEDGTIRISSRLVGVPEYVLDSVILHELTHLVESSHGPEFHRLMARYPKLERAEGFLEAMGLGYD